jgi:hypothetical protein
VGDIMKFYRYQDIFYRSGPKIDLLEFKSIKETPKGWWIVSNYAYPNWLDGNLVEEIDDKRWVSATAMKRFAYPTKKEALYSYKMRKKSQIRILKARLLNAETLLEEIDRVDFEGKPKTFELKGGT